MLSILKKGNIRNSIGSLKNPTTILIKNNFYPSGLSEENIQNYYLINKEKILKQTEDREVMLFVQTEKKIIVKRKDSGGEFFRLKKSNYEKLIHGRVISIHSTMNQNEYIGIVDIDISNFSTAKKVTSIVYDYLINFGEFKSVKIRYTGKESFHIIIEFKQNYLIDRTREYLRQLLINKFEGKYDISGKRQTNKVNLDLSPNKYRGGFITLNSLSVYGLKCIEVPRGRLIRFNQNEAKIK